MILPYKSRKLTKREPVDVYRNVSKQGAVWYSVRQKGKVVAHADEISLKDVTFHVQEKGRKRVLSTGHKNVHAWVKGYLTNYAVARIGKKMERVYYNPVEYKNFVTKKKKRARKISKAKTVVLYSGGVLACRA